MFVLVKTAGESDGFAPQSNRPSRHLDTRLFPTITPLKAGYEKTVTQVEQIAAIISLLGSIAIFLAVVGLLGLVSYAVSQRTREIAIRLALGARHTEIISTVLRRFALDVLIGLVVGVGMTARLADFAAGPLRYQRSGSNQLSKFNRFADRGSRRLPPCCRFTAPCGSTSQEPCIQNDCPGRPGRRRARCMVRVAVGTIIADRPPHRSVRARLRIRLL